MFDPQLGQPVGARLGVHQAEGRSVGGKELAGVGFEGHDAKGGVGSGKVDDGLMAKVNAVKVAHGNRGTAGGGVKVLPVSMNLHD